MWLLLPSQQILSGNSEEKEREEPKRSSQKPSLRQLLPAKIQRVQPCYWPIWGWWIGPKAVIWEKLRMQKTVNLWNTMAVRMLVFKKAVISSLPAQGGSAGRLHTAWLLHTSQHGMSRGEKDSQQGAEVMVIVSRKDTRFHCPELIFWRASMHVWNCGGDQDGTELPQCNELSSVAMFSQVSFA